MGSTSFLGFSCPNLLLVFLNLSFLETCYIFFRECWDFLWELFCFLLSFVLKSKKEKVLDRGQNGFIM